MRGRPDHRTARRRTRHLTGGLLALGLLLLAPLAQAEQRFINIGTGGVTGVYYPAGQHLCRLFNTRRDSHGMRCTAESTGGSVFNLNMVRSGDMDFGVAQSDLQYHAHHGSGRFEAFGPADQKAQIQTVAFGSPAGRVGLEGGWTITGVLVPTERPSPYWFYLPALALGLLVVWNQRRRAEPPGRGPSADTPALSA